MYNNRGFQTVGITSFIQLLFWTRGANMSYSPTQFFWCFFSVLRNFSIPYKNFSNSPSFRQLLVLLLRIKQSNIFNKTSHESIWYHSTVSLIYLTANVKFNRGFSGIENKSRLAWYLLNISSTERKGKWFRTLMILSKNSSISLMFIFSLYREIWCLEKLVTNFFKNHWFIRFIKPVEFLSPSTLYFSSFLHYSSFFLVLRRNMKQYDNCMT